MRRRWQALSESDKIAAQIIVLAALASLYFAWPTPYVERYQVLPQQQGDYELSSIAIYRVQVNRLTGTVWADTVDGWRRVGSKSLPESQLAFKEQGSEWYDPRYRPAK